MFMMNLKSTFFKIFIINRDYRYLITKEIPLCLQKHKIIYEKLLNWDLSWFFLGISIFIPSSNILNFFVNNFFEL